MNAVAVVALFILLTPGLVVKFPSKNIYVIAVVHAVVFAVAFAVLNHLWASYEGFQSDIRPTCPKDTTFNMEIQACCKTVYTDQEDDSPKGSGKCPAGKKWWGATDRCAIKRYTNISPGVCPEDYTQTDENMCRPVPFPTNPVEPTCRQGLFDPEDCTCGDNTIPTCPKRYKLSNFSIGDNDFGCWCLPDVPKPVSVGSPTVPVGIPVGSSTVPVDPSNEGTKTGSVSPSDSYIKQQGPGKQQWQGLQPMSLQLGGADIGYMCFKS